MGSSIGLTSMLMVPGICAYVTHRDTYSISVPPGMLPGDLEKKDSGVVIGSYDARCIFEIKIETTLDEKPEVSMENFL